MVITMIKISNETPKFRLYAQNRGNILVIENLSDKNYFRCTANEILVNQEWSNAFSKEDMEIIQGIAEAEATYK